MTFDDYLAREMPERGSRYDRAKWTVLNERDHWLDLGVPVPAIALQGHCDRRGLPVFRIQAGISTFVHMPAVQIARYGGAGELA